MRDVLNKTICFFNGIWNGFDKTEVKKNRRKMHKSSKELLTAGLGLEI